MKFLQVFLIWAENTAFFAPAPPRNRGRRGRGGNRQTPASSAQRQARAIFFIFASLFFAGGVDLQGKRDYNGHVRAGALILPCLKARVRAVRRHIPPSSPPMAGAVSHKWTLVLRSAILRDKFKIAKLMCALCRKLPWRRTPGFPKETHEISFRQFEKKSVNKNHGASKTTLLRSATLFARAALLRKSEAKRVILLRKSLRREKPGAEAALAANAGFSKRNSRKLFLSVQKQFREL